MKVRGAPRNYRQLLEPLPEGVTISPRLQGKADLWHLFTTSRRELADGLAQAMTGTEGSTAIWVSWPKKASGALTDLTEDVIRELALPLGLVDVKVCAVDETWSGLKLVRRKSVRVPT